jgi:hypothetical protein
MGVGVRKRKGPRRPAGVLARALEILREPRGYPKERVTCVTCLSI